MVSESVSSFQMPEVRRLTSVGVWRPVVVLAGLYGIFEGVTHLFDLSEHVDLAADALLMGALVAGGYVLSTYVSNFMTRVIRRKDEEVLQERQRLVDLERRFDTLIRKSPNGIVLLSAEGSLLYTSPSTRWLTGYAPEELLGRSGFELVHPEDRGDAEARFREAVANRGGTVRLELRLRHRDDSWRWHEAVITNLLADPSIQAVVMDYRDLTERNQADEALRAAKQGLQAALAERERVEEALRRVRDESELRVRELTEDLLRAKQTLQTALAERERVEAALHERQQAEEEHGTSREELHALAGRLLSVQERQRSWFAKQLHDELGQALTALKMDLVWLATRLPAGQWPPVEKVRAMTTLFDSTIRLTRRLVTELRPGVLDDLGLVAALEWQTQEFQSRTGISCEFTSNRDEFVLDSDTRTGVFRICQESLTNVARHARAGSARVSVCEDAGNLILTVADNGRGITEAESVSRSSLGLLGIRERAFLLGGRVTIVGRRGEGTTVTVRVPLKRVSPAS
ncbi:MAG TPA: PAS domain-containing sensor histidine kinase [Candidatus Methylomirabilis sp.]|nr:PAS domain-containing sensor histidine kinase [Candidatus Methylomirabilis sp.]HSB79223.1 PAS domain-containing sensor histidine kinase [Candidatus Methylomirabilis sp.]